MSFTLRDAVDADLPRILEITNHAITDTTAVWSLTPVTLDMRRAWLAERHAKGFPVLVAVDDTSHDVLGFASFGDFRPWEGYQHTVEHSVYIDASARRLGVGSALIAALIVRAEALGKHVMVGGIEAGNTISIEMHTKLGFIETGRMPQVGRKSGRWLDLVFMQRIMNGGLPRG